MALRDAAADLAAFLEPLGLGLTRPPASGANLFSAPLPATPDLCVSLVTNGGGAPLDHLSGGTRRAYYTPTVQVRVRAAADGFPAGQQLANALLEALHLAQPEPYTVLKVDVSAPTYLGTDDSGRHLWGFNALLGYVNTPG